MGYFEVGGMRFEKIIDSPRKHGCFQGSEPWIFSFTEPINQIRSCRRNITTFKDLSLIAPDTIADCFLVDVEPNAMHSFHKSLLWGLTDGDSLRPLTHYELSAFRRLPFLCLCIQTAVFTYLLRF